MANSGAVQGTESLPAVDSGVIQIAIALAAIATLFVDEQSTLAERILGAIVFMGAFSSSQLLFWAFIIDKLPATRAKHLKFIKKHPGFPGPILLWLCGYYPILLARVFAFPHKVPIGEQTHELGYLTLLAALFIGGIATAIHFAYLVVR